MFAIMDLHLRDPFWESETQEVKKGLGTESEARGHEPITAVNDTEGSGGFGGVNVAKLGVSPMRLFGEDRQKGMIEDVGEG